MKARWIGIPVITLTFLGAGEAWANEALARSSGCLECHSVDKGDKKVVGPPFREIAARYKHDRGARAALIERVKKGSKGNWTEVSHGVPMPPYSGRLSDTEIKRLVDWVLGL